MNIADALPTDIERRARALLDDDAFIDPIHSAAVLYHNTREWEINTRGREESKKAWQRLETAAREYIAAATMAGIASNSTEVIAMRQRIKDCEARLELLSSKKERSTSNKSLRMAAHNMRQIFSAHGIPTHGLASFMVHMIPLISPDGDIAPGDSLIQKVARNPEK